jgi:hypothetical protein
MVFNSVDEYYDKAQPTPFTHSSINDKGVRKWSGSDTLTNWENILNGNFPDNGWAYHKHVPNVDWNQLIEYYKDKPIEYRFNSQGFRDTELSDKPNNVDVYIGCSFTSGVGHHIEHTWPYLLGEKLGYPYINAGIGGSGCITQYRTLMFLFKNFNIRNVFHFIPLQHVRWEWFDPADKIHKTWGPGDKASSSTFNILLDDPNISLLNHVFSKATKQICFENNANYFYMDIYPSINLYRDMIELFARDGIHPGTLFQTKLYEIFYKKYRKKLVV